MKKKVLILGGLGFIGHNLALHLKKKKYNVCIFDSLSVNNFLNIIFKAYTSQKIKERHLNFLLKRYELLKKEKIKTFILDIKNREKTSIEMSKFEPDVIVHLSSVSSSIISNQKPFLSYDNQIRSLLVALDWIKNSKNIKKKHLVMASSSTVYGDFKKKTVKEDEALKPTGTYPTAKYVSEKILKDHAKFFGYKYTIVRPSALYGEGCISGRVTQKFLEDALLGKKLRLMGNGKLDFTNIADLVYGIELIIKNRKSHNETFNITYGKARPVSLLTKILKEYFPKLKVEVTKMDRSRPIRGTLSIKKAKKLLNYKPKVKLEAGYKKYIEHYLNSMNK